MNNEKQITRLTLENYDYKVSWEVPYSDSQVQDLCQAFYSLLIGVTYSPETVLEGMKSFAEERLPEEEFPATNEK